MEMFDEEAWERNEWIESEAVQEHFGMTFAECWKEFGFCRKAEWNQYPLEGQKVTTYFRKYK